MIDPYHHLSALAKSKISSRVSADDWAVVTAFLPFRGSVNLIINTHVKRIADTIRRYNLSYSDVLADPGVLDRVLFGGTPVVPARTIGPDDGCDDGHGVGSGSERPPSTAGTASVVRETEGTTKRRPRGKGQAETSSGQGGK